MKYIQWVKDLRRQVAEAATQIGRRMTGRFSKFAAADGTIRIISLQQPLAWVRLQRAPLEREWVLERLSGRLLGGELLFQ